MNSLPAPPMYHDLEANTSGRSGGNSENDRPPDYEPADEQSADQMRADIERKEFQLATLERIQLEERLKVQQELELMKQRYYTARGGRRRETSLSVLLSNRFPLQFNQVGSQGVGRFGQPTISIRRFRSLQRTNCRLRISLVALYGIVCVGFILWIVLGRGCDN